MNDHEKNKIILNFMSYIPEFFCLEDFGNFTMIQTLKNINLAWGNKNPEKFIAVTFFLDGKEIQKINEINFLQQIFFFIKIVYQENYINILINRKKSFNSY